MERHATRAGDRGLRPRTRPVTGSRSSTTTGRCGARSRCRSSSTSPSAAGRRWPSTTRRCARASRSRPRTSKTTRWLGNAMAKHYEGDDSDLKLLMGAVGEAFGDMSVEDYAAEVGAFFAEARTRRSAAPYRDCGYQPMVELLRYLEATASARSSPRAATATSCARSRRRIYGIPPSGSSGRASRSATARTSTAARSSTRPGSTSSTTARRSRCGSGAGSAAAGASRAATPTATCRCCSSPTA